MCHLPLPCPYPTAPAGAAPTNPARLSERMPTPPGLPGTAVRTLGNRGAPPPSALVRSPLRAAGPARGSSP